MVQTLLLLLQFVLHHILLVLQLVVVDLAQIDTDLNLVLQLSQLLLLLVLVELRIYWHRAKPFFEELRGVTSRTSAQLQV